jgi:class 3 adenylate cyclase/tetratricopeptide (TPR) repeat protein
MIICPACASENPADSRFCGNCGTSLARTCPNCGRENPPTNNFCLACGTALRSGSVASPTSKPAPTASADSGERRLVSVLFADLVGFTTFGESRDPEEIRAMLTRYFDRAKEVIERFGGEVDKFIGDAVTAFWGATRAQEDDAERAVRAALELVDAVEALGAELTIPELAVRAGVLSGETSVGSGGNEKGLVVGDVVNTASRLQSAAEPGTVLVGQTTKQLTEAAIRYESLGERAMKGKTLPVAAWRALSVVGERGGRGRGEGLEPPFVGREDELRLLKDQVHATTRDGAARLVSIVGEAGIGKSRLAWELRKYLDGLTESFRWHRGRSPAYGDGVTFWSLAEMVRSRAGISEGENPLKARTKLRTTVAAFVPDPEEQQWIESRLAGLLGLDDMPSGDRNELYASLRTFFQRVATTGTTVLLFEDLQWADDGQLEFIEELVEMSHHHAILVITLARPDLLARRPTWGTARRSLSIHLGPLSDPEMAELVTGLVPGIPEKTLALLIERAGGVPMYAVEYVRMLVNAGDLVLDGSAYRQTRELADVALPDSLHALVGARLDRLDEESRSLIQDAAVLGQSFTLEGMKVLTGAEPEALERELRGLVHRDLLRHDDDPRSPERGQFQFVQSVIREVAYGRIAKVDRKDKHLRVAEYYEREAPVEAAAVIASHYMSAYEADPDQQLADSARAALMNAARRAVELKSHAQALALVDQALQVPGTDEQRAPLWEFIPPAASALFRHEEAIEYARRAHEWYTEHGSEVDVVRSAHVLGTAYIDADEPLDAVEAMASFFDPEQARDHEMLNLGADLARAHMRANQMHEAADVSLAVMIAAEASGDLPMLIDSMNTRGTAVPSLGRRAEGIALLRETLRLAEAAALPYQILRGINNLNVVQAIDGLAGLAASRQRGYELARRVRHGGLLARFTVGHAQSLYYAGRFDEALDVLDESQTWEWSLWADFAGASAELVRWAQTGDADHLTRAREVNRSWLEAHEPQYRAGGIDYEARFLWLLGDLPGAYDLAHQVYPALAHDDHRHTAVGAAIRLKDLDRLRKAADLLEVPYGRRFDLLRSAVDAGLEVLEGDRDRAAILFRDLVDGLDAAESPLVGAEWRAIFAEVMPDRPEARAAAREAYDWYSSVGAQGYLELYAHVWEQTETRNVAG